MFLHTFYPSEVLLHIGGVSVYAYGVTMSLGLLACVGTTFFLAKKFIPVYLRQISDFFLPAGLAAFLGARLFFVFYHPEYFLKHPFEIFFFWQGGLVWHGALAGIVLALFLHAWQSGYSAWRMADVLAPGLAIGQAIGRWGNYFNQEAYGLPTALSWGIPIDPMHRVPGYESFTYFHPTFLYESLGDIIIFFMILLVGKRAINLPAGTLACVYLMLYSTLRFGIEFLRIDPVPILLGLRAPQWISLIIMALVGIHFARASLLLKRK